MKTLEGQKDISYEGVRISKLSFAYDDEQILDNISVDIPTDKIVGIVGKSGSGKSTLLKLLMRFWPATPGAIEISGTPLEQINTSNLRDLESYMTQDTHLYHDSIKNNLRIAKLDATDEEIVEACKKASIHEYISTLPQATTRLLQSLATHFLAESVSVLALLAHSCMTRHSCCLTSQPVT